MLRFPLPSSWFRLRSLCACAGVIAAAGMLLSACSTPPEYKYVATITGGQRIEIPITKRGPAPASEAGLTVMSAQFIGPPRDGLTFLGFVLKNESGQELKNVRVDDVSDATAVKVVEDTSPKVVDGLWRGLSEPIRSVSPPVEWLGFLDSSNRVFRFTVTLADGRTITLHQLTMFPAWLKEGMRRGFKAAEEKEAKPKE